MQPSAVSHRHFSRLTSWPPTAWTSDLRCCRVPTPRTRPPLLPRTCRIQVPEVNTRHVAYTAWMLNHIWAYRVCVNKNCSSAMQGKGTPSTAEKKVELALWELEQWVREEGPTITASYVFTAEILTSRFTGACNVLGLNRKNLSHDVALWVLSGCGLYVVDGRGEEWPTAECSLAAFCPSCKFNKMPRCVVLGGTTPTARHDLNVILLNLAVSLLICMETGL